MASSLLLLKLFYKLPWCWQSWARPGGEAVPIAQLRVCSLVWALPGGTGVSDPLCSPAEDQPRAAKFTPASPVPPISNTTTAQVLTAAHALSTSYTVGSLRLHQGEDWQRPASLCPSPALSFQLWRQEPIDQLRVCCSPVQRDLLWPLHPTVPWHIGEGETESPASQH